MGMIMAGKDYRAGAPRREPAEWTAVGAVPRIVSFAIDFSLPGIFDFMNEN